MKFRSNCFLRSKFLTSTALTLAGLALLASQSAHAASGTWTSTTSGLWSDIANWSSGAGPIADIGALTLAPNAATSASPVVITLDSDRTLSAMGTSGNGAWKISGTSLLTLDSGAGFANLANGFNGIDPYTVDTDILINSNVQIFPVGNNNSSITLGAAGTTHSITGTKNITVTSYGTNSTGAITINSNLSTTGSFANNTSGSGNGNVAINGIIGSGVTGVTENATGTGNGKTLTLTGQNLYSTSTTVSSGILTAIDGLAASPETNNFIKALGTSLVTLSGGTLNLRANGSGVNQTIITGDGITGNNVAVTGNTTITVDRVNATNTGSTIQLNNLNIGAQTLITTAANTYGLQFAGTTTLTGNATLNTSGATGLLTLTGAVDDGSSGFGIIKAGLGKLILSGANTYIGATVHTGGTLSINTLYNGGTASSLGAATGANGTLAIGSTVYTGTLIFTGTGGNGTNGTNGYTDRAIKLAGTTGGVTLDQSGTGQLKFVSDLTATGAGSKTLTLQGSSAGTGEIAGAIVDNSGTNTTSLTKSGSGTWTLSGANTYTGATSVTAGALILSGTAIPDANSLSVTGTGTVSVAGAGTEIVGSLTLGANTYTTGSFTAANSSGFITSGTIQVGAAVGSGYSSWQAANGNTSQTIDQDLDNDGVANGIEYFISGPVADTGFTALPSIMTTGGVQSITFTHAANYTGVYGTDFFVETSTTLAAGSWTTEALNVNVLITGNNVKYTFPAGTTRFARLKVTGP